MALNEDSRFGPQLEFQFIEVELNEPDSLFSFVHHDFIPYVIASQEALHLSRLYMLHSSDDVEQIILLLGLSPRSLYAPGRGNALLQQL